VIIMQIGKQVLIDTLRGWGFSEVADEASRVLPDPVDLEQAEKFLEQHGVPRDELISRMGGSP
jgi:hypothetical protein